MDWIAELVADASRNPFTTSMTLGAFLLAWLGGRHALTEGGLTVRTAWPAAAGISILLGVYTYVVARALGESWSASFIVQGATLFGFYWARPRREPAPKQVRPVPIRPPGTGPASRAFQTRR